MSSSSVPKIIVYAMPGSQFTAKVLAAMQNRQIPHYISFIPINLEERRKFLPSGGTLVPEMAVYNNNENDAPTIVSDSEVILEWLDQNYQPENQKEPLLFFPKQPECSQVSKRASNEKLAGLVWYYNWVEDKGFHNSMLKSIKKFALPSYLSWAVPNFVVRGSLASTRQKFRAQAAQAIGVTPQQLDDEPAMRQLLIEELKYFQSLLEDGEQQYLIPQTTRPTAADFSVYAQLERLVGEGTASDVTVYPAIQEFKDQQKETLQRLWQWYDHMRATCPVQFKNKRPPPELLGDKTAKS